MENISSSKKDIASDFSIGAAASLRELDHEDTEFNIEEESLDYKEFDIWMNLTDSILLLVLSFLDCMSLTSAARTCKNWNRVADDESLWKALVQSKLDIKGISLPRGKTSWRAEYRRLAYHAPVVFSDEMTGHTDEIYHVSFSSTGRYFSTTGRDASVKIWEFGYPSKLYADNTNLRQQGTLAYTRFSEFNKSETLILVAGVAGFYGSSSIIIILSVCKDLPVIYVVSGTNSNFRGAWLDDSTFLNGVERQNDFYLEKHTVSVKNSAKKTPQELLDMYEDSGIFLMKVRPRSILNDFVRVISLQDDISQNSEEISQACSSDDFNSNSSRSKAVIMSCSAHNSEEQSVYIALYKLSKADKDGTMLHTFEQIQTKNEGGMVGLALSADERFLVYNYRRMIHEPEDDEEEDIGVYSRDIDLCVYDLYAMKDTEEHYGGHKASTTTNLSYIFPAICEDYVSSGSECSKGYVWDRHYGKILSELNHSEQPGNGGVNAAIFHPKSCEILLTVGDDRKVKIWRSKRLVREHEVNLMQEEGKQQTFKDGCHGDDLEDGCDDEVTTVCCGVKKKNKHRSVQCVHQNK